MRPSFKCLQQQTFLSPLTKPIPLPEQIFHFEDPSVQLTLYGDLQDPSQSKLIPIDSIITNLNFKTIPRKSIFQASGDGIPSLLVYYEYLNVILQNELETTTNPQKVAQRIQKLNERFEFAKAIERQGEKYWAIRHLLCGEVDSSTHCECLDCNHVRSYKTSRCDLRGCPQCAATRANKLRYAYRKDLAKHFNPDTITWKNATNLRFLTLTFPNIQSIDDLDYDYYLKCLNRFLRRKGTSKYKGAAQYIEKYLYRFECPYKSKEKGYNPHFHLLIHSKIIPVEHLKELWIDATKGTAKIVDIRNCKDAESASNEAIKYCAKADDFCNLDERAKFMIKMRNRRFLGVSGFVADPKSPLTCEECGGTEWRFLCGSTNVDRLNQEIMSFQQKKSTL